MTNWIDNAHELLTVGEMYRADEAASAAGVSGLELMEAAGVAVADAVAELCPAGRVAILCGPGNNGGDGFVAARVLAGRGREVVLALLGDVDSLRGDAAENAARWTGDIMPLGPGALDGAAVVVDAIFGAGLSRPVDGEPRSVLEAVGAREIPCVAVDVPSGVNGDDGRVQGFAACADTTVTFFRRKPGHLLYPGRALCGRVRVADIGTPPGVLNDLAPGHSENGPALWLAHFPWPEPQAHKYSRGHAVVVGGRELTGAARLAARAALRVGAGAVTIMAHPDAIAVYRSGQPSVMVRAAADAAAFGSLVDDPRLRAILVGPGNGIREETREMTMVALGSDAACVIDADAISAFADGAARLFEAIGAREMPVVLTPHEREFTRLFGPDIDLESRGRLGAAEAAARLSGATVVLKGADTVIASPDGRIAINSNAPPDLATAGSGDVLAGFVTGLLAQATGAFDAAAAGVWLHGAAAGEFGPGLIADDIADALPPVLRRLRSDRAKAEE